MNIILIEIHIINLWNKDLMISKRNTLRMLCKGRKKEWLKRFNRLRVRRSTRKVKNQYKRSKNSK